MLSPLPGSTGVELGEATVLVMSMLEIKGKNTESVDVLPVCTKKLVLLVS